MAITDEETVAAFVLRARRIESHSLVQDRGTLRTLVEQTSTMQLAADGQATVRRALPANEEVFESLAARVRPLTLASEPIYYVKVLAAVERLLNAAPSVSPAQREQFDQLNTAWPATALGQQLQAYAMRLENLDGTGRTDVTDTELAAGWMYADLVHADPRDWKKKALEFPLSERYAAAVNVFARIAALTVTTLRFLEQLQHADVIVINDQVWEEDVVVGVAEILYEGVAVYEGSPETAIPEQLDDAGDAWTPLTITRQLRTNPADQVRVDLADADGTVVATYDAAVVHRGREDGIMHWHVLVGDSVIFQVQVRAEGENRGPFSLDMALAGETHRTLLAANALLLQLHQAQTVTFVVQNEVLLQYTPEVQRPEKLNQLQATVELLEDLVGLEELTGQAIGAFTRPLTLMERVRVRQAHLLWRNKVVEWDRAVPPLVSSEGVTPRWGMFEASVLDIGGAQVALPEFRVGHPEATWQDQGPAAEAGPKARTFTAVIAEGTRFLAWPAHSALPDEQEPQDGAPWGLTGIDPAACAF